MTTPGEPSSPAPDVGRFVAGRYRLAEVIGVGGMATIHRAIDTKFDRPVAIKLLRREVIADTDIAMRFRREALAATVLRHPNIVACLETGTDDGQPFLVMELIDGEDLAARLKRVGLLTPAEATRIGLDVARALGVAHVRGIVHRDIKPGNILLARDGRAMVTDFGIARVGADAEGAIPGTTLGSVHYFSPEQATGATTTAASDVYSLGLVLYESLTGQRAWSGDSTASLASVRVGAPAPSPRSIRPEIPRTLDAAVVHALDPDPARRYPNGNAMASALEAIETYPDPSSPTQATDTAMLVAAAAASAVTAEPAPVSAPPLRHQEVTTNGILPPALRSPSPAIAGPLVVLALVVAVVAGALLVASLSGRSDGGPVAIASPSARPTVVPTASPDPTASPRPTPSPKRSATPKPPASVGPGGGKDLCDPFLGIPCGADAGTYAPSKFTPAIRFELGRGWSVSDNEPDLIALGRDEGSLTIVSAITAVYPNGQTTAAPDSARALVEAFIGTNDVAARKPVAQKVDKHKATRVDLAPTGEDRVALFATDSQTYYLESNRTTRLVVVDAPGGPIVIAIAAGENQALDRITPTTDSIVKSLQFR